MRGWLGLGLVLGALAAAPARAEWRRAESPNFIVYSEVSEARLRERVTLLENFDRLLRLMLRRRGRARAQQAPRLHRRRPCRAAAHPAGPAGHRRLLYGLRRRHRRLRRSAGRSDARQRRSCSTNMPIISCGSTRPTPIRPGMSKALPNISRPPLQRAARSTSAIFAGPRLCRSSRATGCRWSGSCRRHDGPEPRADRALLRAELAAHPLFLQHARAAGGAAAATSPRCAPGDPRAALQAATGLTPAASHRRAAALYSRRADRYRRMRREAAGAAGAGHGHRAAALGGRPDALRSRAVGSASRDERGGRDLQQIRTAAARHPDDPFARRVLAHAEVLLRRRRPPRTGCSTG